ncbi:peroxidase 53-like [Arachis duranensis]|uniref:Peroxidase n=1 Tax=Arachis duranensis TaxID=130453 RepID=A0A6P5NGR1_ARADU|nr:peroxidase 53-like [Arachis duranensis]
MKFLFLFLFPLVLCVVVPTRAQLDPFFYKDTCPSLQSTVRQVLLNVSKGPGKDERLFASLIRLHFHDCFVQGCDGSILLNDTAFIKSEQLAAPNLNSIRRLDVINLIKENIEEACPGVVSCADIVALAAEVSSEMSNGPTWQVPLGRRDSETASFDLANSDIPGPRSNLPQLISAFQKKGLDMNDLVALSGAHTIGRGRCTLSRRRNCKNDGLPGENVTNLDQISPFEFDNNYYINILRGDAPFKSDQVLIKARGEQTINVLASNQTLFFEAFKASMIKMSMIEVLVGEQGIIRKHCNFINI